MTQDPDADPERESVAVCTGRPSANRRVAQATKVLATRRSEPPRILRRLLRLRMEPR
jgi:hypothetical protein